MKFTVHNTGCGLGDMLHRIDAVYRYCRKYNHEFFFPDVASRLHSQDYGSLLGLHNIKPNAKNWTGPRERVGLAHLLSPTNPQTDIASEDVLHEVEFDYSISKQFFDKNELSAQPKFDYSQIIKNQFPSSTTKRFDFLIHLRLGDNYAYPLPNGGVLDAGKRRVVLEKEAAAEILREQWSIEDVKNICAKLDKDQKTYCIHCDGIDSAIRHIQWHRDPYYAENRKMLMDAVITFFTEFESTCGGIPNMQIGNTDIISSIDDLLASRFLVYTTGGFMRGINKFWNTPPIKTEALTSFAQRTLTSI